MNVKISAIDKAKFATKGMKILKDLKENPRKQERLIKVLELNDFPEIAELARDAQKYLEEV